MNLDKIEKLFIELRHFDKLELKILEIKYRSKKEIYKILGFSFFVIPIMLASIVHLISTTYKYELIYVLIIFLLSIAGFIYISIKEKQLSMKHLAITIMIERINSGIDASPIKRSHLSLVPSIKKEK